MAGGLPACGGVAGGLPACGGVAGVYQPVVGGGGGGGRGVYQPVVGWGIPACGRFLWFLLVDSLCGPLL